jgi:plastocyanin
VRVPMTFGAILTLGLAAACGGGGVTTPTPAAGTATPAAGTPAATATPAAAATTPAAAAVVCDATGEGTAVNIAGFAYDPSQATVATDGFVTFTNNDTTSHTVTFDGGPNCGNVSSGGDSVTVQFTAAGSYAYHCTIHPDMMGAIEVS